MATTISVSEALRERINSVAREQGVTAADLIEALLDAHERRQRIEAFGRAFRSADDSYWEEFHSWA